MMNPVLGVTMKALLMVTAKPTHAVSAGVRADGRIKY